VSLVISSVLCISLSRSHSLTTQYSASEAADIQSYTGTVVRKIWYYPARISLWSFMLVGVLLLCQFIYPKLSSEIIIVMQVGM